MKKPLNHRFIVRSYREGWFATIRRPSTKYVPHDTFCVDTATYSTMPDAIKEAREIAARLGLKLGKPQVWDLDAKLIRR